MKGNSGFPIFLWPRCLSGTSGLSTGLPRLWLRQDLEVPGLGGPFLTPGEPDTALEHTAGQALCLPWASSSSPLSPPTQAVLSAFETLPYSILLGASFVSLTRASPVLSTT